MANQTSGPGRRGEDTQRQNRQDDQQNQQRSPGGNQGGQPDDQSGKNAEPVLPEGEKVGEWSDNESDKKE